jgi:polysaccharide export outer membrane protein
VSHLRGVLAALLLAGAAVAQEASAPASPSPAPSPSADYRIGPGDVLDVVVVGSEELSRRDATVQTDGTINLPALGAVPVAGLTIGEIRQLLMARLGRDVLVRPPLVEVAVREYRSQFVTVVGEVNSPGRKALKGRTRLIDVLVESGGFTPRASGEVVITRTSGSFEGGARTLTMRFGGGAPTPIDQVNLEVLVQHGDIVAVSAKSFVTVMGEVHRPGRYAIEGDATVTVAVTLAGGLTRFASQKVRVKRTHPETGKDEVFTVDLKAVGKGRKPDVRVQANDVITVSRRIF